MPGIAIWHWWSIEQGLLAARFSERCRELENTTPSPDPQNEPAREEHRACAIASILGSAAFLEATVNETFASAEHANLAAGGGGLSETERSVLIESADLLTNNRLLDRFQLALMLLKRPAFDRGANPYQDTADVVTLRNELVHYKPRWRSGGGEDDTEKRLRGLKSKGFAPNPYTSPGNPFFPDKCLGHGCTSWAWRSVLAFADEFFGRLGVEPVYEHHRERFKRAAL